MKKHISVLILSLLLCSIYVHSLWYTIPISDTSDNNDPHYTNDKDMSNHTEPEAYTNIETYSFPADKNGQLHH